MISAGIRHLVLLNALIVSFLCPTMVIATITLDNLWAPEWSREEDIKRFKKELGEYLPSTHIKEFVDLLLEKRFEELEETLEKITMAKYLNQFLLGYGEEGEMVQYVELVDETFLVRWPVPIARTKGLRRRLREELKSARNEVEGIFKNVIGIELYKGIVPVWIEYSGDKEVAGSPRVAGITIGGSLILLFLPGIPSMDKDGIWQLPGYEIKSLVETAKHEFIHFYVNRILGYYRSKKLPHDFHEGLATSLINASIEKVAYVETKFIAPRSYVRTTKIVEAPETYKRYHLQMKYLRQNYGNTRFYTFLKKILSGDDLNHSVRDVFGVSSWEKLFPSNLSLWTVQKEIALNAVYIFISVIIGVIGIVVFWYMFFPRRYVITTLFRKRSLIFETLVIVEKLSKFKLKVSKQFFLKPKNIIIIISVIFGAWIFDLYRKWSLTLNIDTPPSVFLTLIYFDSVIGAGILISAVTTILLTYLFLRRLEIEIKQFERDVSLLDISTTDKLRYTFLFNHALTELKKLESNFKLFPASNRIVEHGNRVKSVLEKLVLKEISQRIDSYLSKELFKDAYNEYVDYLEKIRDLVSDACKNELLKIAKNIVEIIFKKVISLVDSERIEEAEELSELMKQVVKEEKIEEAKRLISEAEMRIWAFAEKTIHEKFGMVVDFEKLRLLFSEMSVSELLSLLLRKDNVL